jgi:hypothetical protein
MRKDVTKIEPQAPTTVCFHQSMFLRQAHRFQASCPTFQPVWSGEPILCTGAHRSEVNLEVCQLFVLGFTCRKLNAGLKAVSLKSFVSMSFVASLKGVVSFRGVVSINGVVSQEALQRSRLVQAVRVRGRLRCQKIAVLSECGSQCSPRVLLTVNNHLVIRYPLDSSQGETSPKCWTNKTT